MPATDLNIKQALIGSGHKFRREILMMPIVQLEDSLAHMTIRYGIRGKETVGALGSGAQFRPYQTAKNAGNTTAIDSRTLETFLGDVLEEFDPYQLYDTIYGEPISKKRTDLEIVKAMAVAMSMSCSENMGYALFKAARDASGTTTMDLFNGFATIAASEVTAGNISASNGNYYNAETITEANVGDVLLAIYQNSSPVLKKKQQLKMFIPTYIKELYDKWCLAEMGSVVYNNKYEKSYLHGTNNRVELVDLVGMEESSYIFLTTKKNMLVGVDQTSDKERVEINKCDNPKVVQFFMTMYFGVQFESIDKKTFMCAGFTYNAEGVPTLVTTPASAIAYGDVTENTTKSENIVVTADSLSGPLSVVCQGTGFTCATSSISKANAEATGGNTITVVFSPVAVTDYTGKILVYNSADDLVKEIALSGSGIAAAAGD